MDKKQYFETPAIAGERILEGATKAMGLEIAERLLDLHAPGIEPDDVGANFALVEIIVTTTNFG